MTKTATGASQDAAGAAASPLVKGYRGVAIATVAAFFLAVSGAFGTADLPLGARLLFWLAVMESAALIGIGLSSAIAEWGKLRARPWLEGAAITLGVAVPTLTIVIGVGALVGRDPPNVPQALATFATVVLVAGVITSLNYLIAAHAPPPRTDEGDGLRVEDVEGDAGPDGFAQLRQRLSPALRNARIQALQAEDHYVRVHTEHGSEMILMRLSDAVAEAAAIEGLQTHRSWWVSRSAVTDAARSGDRAVIRLENGVRVPVSRTYIRRLSTSGWFDSQPTVRPGRSGSQ